MTWFDNSEGRYGESGKKGDRGEEIVKRYLTESGNTKMSFEHKTDYVSQVIDKIDFIVNGKMMDVKTNVGNGILKVELWSDRKKGWLWTTKAELIYAVDDYKEEIFEYSVEEMRSYVTDGLILDRLDKYRTSDGSILVNIKTDSNQLVRKLK